MADKIKIVLALDGEQQFAQGMRNATESVKLCKQEEKNLQEQFKDSANTLEALTKKQEALAKAQDSYQRALDQAKIGQQHAVENYKKCGKALEDLKKDLDQAEDALKDMEKAGDTSSKAYQDQKKAVENLQKAVERQSTEYAKAEGNITKWDTKVSKAKSDVEKNSKAVDKNSKHLDEARNSADHCATSIDRFGKEVKEAGNEAKDAGNDVKSFGDKLKTGAILKAGAMATQGIAKLGQKAVEAAKYVVEVGSEFEAAMSKVEALSGASGTELDALKEKASMLGRTTQFSASEAADALGNMALAGWDTNEMLNGIDGVLQMAAASGMDLSTAADSIAGNLAAFGMKASESTKLADIMATAQAKSKTTADQLSEAYGTCATNLHQAGQSVETTTALIEGLASVNDTGSSAGTHLSAVIAQMTQKMKDGKIAIGDTKVAVKDQNGNFRDMIDIIEDVEKATEGMTDAERAEALQKTFNRQSMSAMNELLSVGSSNLRTYKTDLQNSSGAAEGMAKTMNNNLKGAVKEMNSATEGLGIALYDKVSGPITGAVNIATGLINGITDAITPEKTEMEQFISEIDALNKSTQDSINSAQTAMVKSASDMAELDGLADIVKGINEQFSIFVKTDTSPVVSDLNSTASGAGSSLSGMSQDIEGVFRDLEDLKNADVSAPESLAGAAEESEKQLNGISSAAEGSKESMEGLGEADVSEPSGLGVLSKNTSTKFLDIDTAAKGAKDSIEDFGEADTESLNSALSEVGDTAEHSAGQMDEWSKFRLKNAVSELAGVIPKIGDAWDEVTGTLNMTEAEFDQLIEKQKIAVRAQALEMAKVDAMQAEMSAELAERMAQNSLDAILKQASEVSGETINTFGELQGKVTDISNKWKGMVPEGTADAALVSLLGTAQDAKNELDEATESLETTGRTMDDVNQAADELAKEYGIDAVNAIKEASEATAENAEAVSALSEAEQEALDASRTEAIASAHKAAADKISAAYEAAKQSIIDSFKIDLGSEWDGGLDETVEKMTENLASQIQGMQDYEKNLSLVKDHVGKEIAPEFMDYLEGMGKDGANILSHIAKTFEEDNGAEKVQKLSDHYIEAMNISDDIAKAGAADIVALKSKLGEFGSKAEEWVDLSGVVDKLQEGGDSVSEATLSAFSEAIENAKEAGVAIPEGLAEGIESSPDGLEAGVQHATEVIQSAIEGQASGLLDMAKQAGLQVPQSIQDGIAEGGDAAQTAMTELLTLISQAASDAEGTAQEAGETVAESVTSAVEDKEDAASSAGSTLAGGAAAGAKGKTSDMSTAGTSLGSALANGINNQQGAARGAGMLVAMAARSGASGVGGFYDVGANMASGIASGIRGNGSTIVDALVAQVRAGIRAAKNEAGIKSPSKVFRDQVGKQISAGIAVGITQSTKDTVDAATAQMNKTLAAVQAWALKNKSKFGGTGQQWADNVAYMWQKLADVEVKNKFGISTTKKSSSGKTEKKSTEEYYTDIYRAAQQYMKNVQALYHTSDKQELEYWQKVKKGLKRGTQAWFDACAEIQRLQDEIRENEKQAAADARAQILSDAETYVKEMKDMNKMSVAQEIAYWRKIREQLKKGSEEWKTATQNIIDCKERIGTVKVADTILDNYSTYYDVSLKAEMDYWYKVRLQYSAGTEKRIEADQKYLDAKKKYNDKLKEIEDDYAQKIAETNQKYTDALNTRKEEIMSSYDLFDYFESSSASGSELLFNMQTQARGYEEWNKSIEELQNRGILSDDLMEQLIDKGPSSIASIKALLTLTNDQLKDYQKAYDDKEVAAEARAKKDTADLKAEVDSELKELRKQQSAELAEINKEINADLLSLANNIRTIAEDQTAALVAAFTAAGSKMTASTGSSVSSTITGDAGISGAILTDALKAVKSQNSGMTAEKSVAKADYERRLKNAQAEATAAQKAVTNAEKALTTANSALTKAQKALDTAKAKQKTVNANKKSTAKQKTDAKNAVTNATTTVNSAKSAVSKAKTTLSDAKKTLKEKNAAVEAIKKAGYRSGTRRIGADGLIWMDEELSSVGPEMIVRKSDNAILTRAQAGDTIIPANLADNLFKWGAIDPAMLNTASMASLNQRLLEGYQASMKANAQQVTRLDQMLSLMSEFMPYLADRMTAPIQSRDAVTVMSNDISRDMAARARRHR